MSVSGIYKCQYEFNAESKKELSLKTGDIVKVTRQVNPDWYFGITAENQDGLFPSAYVEQIFDFIPDRIAVATNSFHAEDKRDLELKKGDIVIILKELDANWYQGSTNKNNGIFPVTYVSEIIFTKDSKRQNETVKNMAYGVANQSFISQESDELSIKKGAQVELLKEIDSFWMLGKFNDKEGKFPKSFVDIIVDLPSQYKVNDVSPSQMEDKLEAKAKAKFMFVAAKEGELSFDKGEIIMLTNRINDDWLEGKIGNSTGIFPSNHVQILVDLPYSAPKKITTANKGAFTQDSNSCDQVSKQEAKILHNKQPKPPPVRPQPSQKSLTRSNSSKIENKRKSLPSNFKIDRQIENNSPYEVKSEKQQNNKETLKKSNSFTQRLKKPLIASKPDTLKASSKTKNSSSYEFELTEEKLYDISPSTPTKEERPIIADKSFTLQPKRKAPVAPRRAQTAKKSSTISPNVHPEKGPPKLPKPLAPMPAAQTTPKKASRPTTLPVKPPLSPVSPNANVKSGSLSVSFKKHPVGSRSSIDVTEGSDNFPMHMSRSETDPQLSKSKIHHQTSISGDTVYFSSTQSSPMLSPDRRKSTLDAMLSKGSLHQPITNGVDSTPSEEDPLENLQQKNQLSLQLKRVENEIVELKGKLEEEAHLLSGVETLLDFVAEDKFNDLLAKKDQHNSNIIELNNELIALEDEKSYLLASFGKTDDIKNRVAELEKQIDMYLDNCEQLRRMQDVAVMEDLPEIRDSIEFCENMVDTLQSELNGLKVKLGDIDQPDSVPVSGLDEEDGREKKKRKQKKVIEELTITERSYILNMSLVVEKLMKTLIEFKNADIDVETLFGNLADIVKLSTKLSAKLDELNKESENGNDGVTQSIANLFLEVAVEMKECYAVYCRNYDDAQMLLEKYEEDPVISLQLKKAVDTISNETGCFGLSSLLIKPVQRVLKYPLLLSELIKSHYEGNKDVLVRAFNTVTDVATAINEFKRRKDLVQKYRDIDDGLGKRVQKLNWHSVAKKTNRINQRITQFTGLNTQTVDGKFQEEERRFRSLEKLVKSVLKNTLQFIDEFKEYSSLERQSAESLFQQSRNEKSPSDEIVKYYSKVTAIAEVYANEMVRFIEEHVNEPLSQLLQLFQGPFRLIQKRNDKCLDYDRAKNKAARAKDSKEKEKIRQSQEELQTAENVYTALNAQLLEELPSLCDKCASFIQFCLANFVEAYRRYFSKAFRQFKEIWELPFIDKSYDLFAVHHERVQEAAHHLSSLIFVPTASSSSVKDRRSQTQVVNMTNFFVEFGANQPATDSKPLIDFTHEDEAELSDQSNHFSPPIAKKDLESPLKPTKAFPTENKTERDEPQFVVKFDFEAEDAAEITAKEGTIVSVLRRSDKNGNSEWWLVEYDDKRGYIPAAFLEENTDRNDGNNNNKELCINGHTSLKEETLISSTKSNNDLTNYVEYFALEFDFEGLNKGELTASEGQIVKVLNKQDQKGNEEWWLVELEGKKGYVPRNYLLFVNRVPIT